MIWVNGLMVDHKTQVRIDDRGFLLGEGVFETIALRNNDICHWQAHWSRLLRGLKYFGIDCQYSEAEIATAVKEAVRLNLKEEHHGTIRISVSSGAGGRGLAPATNGPANWVIQVSPHTESKQLISMAETHILRPSQNPTSLYKTLSYADNIMARRLSAADEVFFFNEHGRVACAAAGNIFILFNDQLITPPCNEGTLNGIVRQVMLEKGIISNAMSREAPISRDDMRQADAIFVTNSLIGAQSVQALMLKNEAPIKKGSPRAAEILLTIRKLAFNS